MKKIEKMIHQIIRFRGNIEAFLVSIEEFSRSTNFNCIFSKLQGEGGGIKKNSSMHAFPIESDMHFLKASLKIMIKILKVFTCSGPSAVVSSLGHSSVYGGGLAASEVKTYKYRFLMVLPFSAGSRCG